MRPPHYVKALVIALRAYSFPATLVPVLAAAALAWVERMPVRWELLPVLLIGTLALHAATNLLNDLEDHRRGIDTPEHPGSSGMLAAKLPRRDVAWEAAAALGLAFAAAVVLAFVRGPLVALMGLAGVAGACAYSSPPLGLKYRAMGDLLVFLMMGPGLLLGSQYVLTGSATPAACALSLAIGALVTAILHANNMRDAGRDRESGFITLAARLGVKGALALLLALLAIGYAVPAAMAATGTTGLWVLAPLATLPFAAWQAWFIARNVQAPDRLADVDRRLAGLHSMYGLALVLGTVAGRL